MGGRARPVKVKVCGLTRPEDALAAEELGVDAIGLVFAESRRRVDEAAAREVVSAVGPFVVKVGVFRDQPLDEVLRLVSRLRLDAVQLHGAEDVAYAAAVREAAAVVRAVSAEEAPTPEALDGYPADAFMLDAREPGSGRAFDWEGAAAWRGHPRLVVAGGLRPRNVVSAIRALAPYAVDVSSGVESAPGVKDRRLMAAFVRAARSVVIHSPAGRTAAGWGRPRRVRCGGDEGAGVIHKQGRFSAGLWTRRRAPEKVAGRTRRNGECRPGRYLLGRPDAPSAISERAPPVNRHTYPQRRGCAAEAVRHGSGRPADVRC